MFNWASLPEEVWNIPGLLVTAKNTQTDCQTKANSAHEHTQTSNYIYSLFG